jgi:hypothetical protein
MMTTFWSTVCLIGVWGFVGATVGFILKAFPARGVFDRRSSLPWGVALLVCFVLWMVGMANA